MIKHRPLDQSISSLNAMRVEMTMKRKRNSIVFGLDGLDLLHVKDLEQDVTQSSPAIITYVPARGIATSSREPTRSIPNPLLKQAHNRLYDELKKYFFL